MARILTITSWYPPHHYGGYELSCFDVMSRFERAGHDVRVLCGDERLPGAEARELGHERAVFRDLRPHWRESERRRPALRQRARIERDNRSTVERHIAEHRPDVVSIWHMAAISGSLLQYVRRHDLPVVYVVCDDWPVYLPKVDPWLSLFQGGPARRAGGRVVEAATGLVTRIDDHGWDGTYCFVSEATRRRVSAEAPARYACSTVVYSGIERGAFGPAAEESEWGWRLLYIGRFDALKGVDTLLRALPHLPKEASLECYGRGAGKERERLTELARSLGVGDRVTFDSLERHELATRYRAADVVVFPSEWHEPFGLVPLEAMACGTPVVATGVGGSGEFLRDGLNCVLFPSGDPAALANAVDRVHRDPELRRRVRAGGLETATELGVDRLADVLEQWHVAAARRYEGGRPPDRVLNLPGS
jgi:glycosyltransferase involved in cell wall biosynthesis